MTPQDLEKFRVTFDQDAATILLTGGTEYSSEKDCLSNFKQVAELLGVTPHQVACVYLLKHITAICNNVSVREPMMGRFHDAANYIKLIAALSTESQRKEESPHPVDIAHELAQARMKYNGSAQLAQELQKHQGR